MDISCLLGLFMNGIDGLCFGKSIGFVFMQRDNPRKMENDETAAKAAFLPLPTVFPLHSLSVTISHIAGFCFFIIARRFTDLRQGGGVMYKKKL